MIVMLRNILKTDDHSEDKSKVLKNFDVANGIIIYNYLTHKSAQFEEIYH